MATKATASPVTCLTAASVLERKMSPASLRTGSDRLREGRTGAAIFRPCAYTRAAVDGSGLIETHVSESVMARAGAVASAAGHCTRLEEGRRRSELMRVSRRVVVCA